MSRLRYRQIKDGEEYAIPPDMKHRAACCDCGLIHRYEYAVVMTGPAINLPRRDFMKLMKLCKPVIQVRPFRDDRATAGRRRGGKVKARIRAIARKVRA